MNKPAITKEQFREGQEIPDCLSCEERLANITNDNNLCLHCEDVTGSNCLKDGCKAERLQNSQHCKDHVVERLYELYEEIFEMVEELEEEREVIRDTEHDAHEKKLEGLKAKSIEASGRIRAMKNSYTHKNEQLMGLAEEAQHLQNLVDVHAINFK